MLLFVPAVQAGLEDDKAAAAAPRAVVLSLAMPAGGADGDAEPPEAGLSPVSPSKGGHGPVNKPNAVMETEEAQAEGAQATAQIAALVIKSA